MEPIAGPVGELLASVRLAAPAIPFISDVTGTWITAAEATDPAYWVSHLLRPVRFGEGIAELGKDPARAFLEVGPGQSLGSLAAQHPVIGNGRIMAASLRHAYERQPDGAFLTGALARLWLAGCRIDWAGFHDGERRRRVPLPTYPFERKRYWISGTAAAPAEAGRSEAAARVEAPRHGRPSSLRNAFVPPDTELERAVAGLWERLLGIAGIGLHDNFFELGGHSLLGTHLVNMAREVLGIDVPLNALFETPTVAGMTAAVAAGRAAGGGTGQAPPLVPLVRIAREEVGEQGLPLSFSQSRMWFLHRLEPASPAYNIPFAVRLQGEAVPQALLAAVRGVVQRHEALRTTFPDAPGAPGTASQVIAPAAAAAHFAVPVIDLSGLSEGGAETPRQSELDRLAVLSARAPFDLATGPLLRVTLVRLAAEEHALLLNMHHIVSDGWSVGVFLGEMSALYEDFRLGKEPALPPLPLQYADFAAWQSRWLQGEVLERHLGYWTTKLAGRPAVLELPVDHPRRDLGVSVAGEVSLVLPAAVAVPLRSLAEREAVTPFIALLALFGIVLSRWCRQDDIVVGTPIANRTRAEISGIIGFFVNTLVLR
ncbi:MAG TPA: condensation domain-containing protein, partial [Thermoanaerobaculia bacterium]